jgi:hypothetical protein
MVLGYVTCKNILMVTFKMITLISVGIPSKIFHQRVKLIYKKETF